MKKRCSQCSDLFKESTTKYWARLANNWPILCNSCFRILHAEGRANARKCKEIEQEIVRKSNMIAAGPVTLMRKEKVTYDQSKKMIENAKR